MNLRPLILLFLLTACSEAQQIFTPVTVEVPVPVACDVPMPKPPPDLMTALPKIASLTDGMKACLQQTFLDRAWQVEVMQAFR
jgi:hypothetical protein